jgi:putative DNA primase/helicase
VKEFNPQFLSAHITKQKCRAEFFGNDSDPLIEKAKIHRKTSVEYLNRGLSERPSSQVFFSEKTSYSAEQDRDIFSNANQSSDSSFLTANMKKKKNEKKAKKRKKKSKELLLALEDNVLEKSPRNANVLSDFYKTKQHILSQNGVLYVYHEDEGCYHARSRNDIAADIKDILDEDTQLRIGIRDYKEAFDQLIISKEISAEEGFFENRPYVNCLNGIVDIRSGALLDHSPEFRFKHCIRARYIPDSGCPRFLDYLESITGGDKKLKKLLRVVIGYMLSHYNNAKVAFLIYGIPHTGKSVLCNLISRIIGNDYVSNIDIAMLHRQEYAASLANSLLNVAPDLKNEPLKDVGFFKSLVSKDDTITARTLYSNPTKIKCETKMLLSTNHFISFAPEVGVYDIEAVFNRLLYIPFQNPPIKDSDNNKHLSDELFEERDAIFTWAMGGLRYYAEHNENFPECTLSAEIKARNMAQFCPEKIFFSEAIEQAEGKYESSSAIKAEFEAFCFEIGAKVKGNIHAYLEEHEHLPKSKRRIDGNGDPCSNGNPIYVYEGIRLKNNAE